MKAVIDYVPQQYQYIIKNALSAWYGEDEFVECKLEDLIGLREFLIKEIKA